MVQGRRKGSSGWAFRFMASHMAKKAAERERGTKGDSQKEKRDERKGKCKELFEISLTLRFKEKLKAEKTETQMFQ